MAIQLIDALHADGSLEMDGDKLRVSTALQAAIAAGANVVEFPSSHPDSVIFSGTPDVLPAGWGIYSDALGGSDVRAATACILSPGAPAVGVDPYVNTVPSGNNASSIQYNVNSSRPGWWHFKIPHETPLNATRWLLAKRQASDLPADFTVIIRFVTFPARAGNYNGQFEAGVYGEASGMVRPGVVAGGACVAISVRPNAGFFETNLVASNGTSFTTVAKSFTIPAGNVFALPEYTKLVRRAGIVYGYVGWSGGSWTLAGTLSVGTGGALRWWGFMNVSGDPAVVPYPYAGLNYMHRYDTNPPL